MKKSFLSELFNKMFHSGSIVNLFIGINILVFVVIRLLMVVESIFNLSHELSSLLVLNLAMPPQLPLLAYKFWTPFTYMFAHQGFFHIFFNLLWLYWMGRIFEEFLKTRQFIFTYIAGGLSGALLFIAAFNLLPGLNQSPLATSAPLIGASAGIMAIIVGTATLLPDYSIMLLLFGEIKLKYLVVGYVVLDVLLIAEQPGTSFAHIGGALLGFVYIRQLKNGNDWSKLFERKKTPLKVVSKGNTRTGSVHSKTSQEIIDRILDKISHSGYDSLSKHEKEQLFNASKNNESQEK